MGKRPASARLFVALYPPAETARALIDALRALDLPEGRRVPTPQIHMTVHFIGEHPAKELESATESVRRAASGIAAFSLTPTRLIGLPGRGFSRLVATETDAPPPLLELQKRLVQRFARQPRRNPSDKFRPHLTLQRFKSPTRREIDAPLEVAPFAADRIALIRSVLSPQGANHEEVSGVELEPTS